MRILREDIIILYIGLKVILEISNLSYNFGDKNLFSDVSFKVLQGEKILLVQGESGTGKSTLVKMLLRYINVSYGYIKGR